MTEYSKGVVWAVRDAPPGAAWFVVFSGLRNGVDRVITRADDLFSTWSLAMNEYREHDRKVKEAIMARPPAATAAVLTTSGLVIKGDVEHRPGDPIIGPDKRVHYVERIATHLDLVTAPAGLDAELPLFFD